MRTLRSAGAHAWMSPSFPAVTAAFAAVLVAACTPPESDKEPSPRAPEPSSHPEAAAFARSIKARFPAAFVEPGGAPSPAVTLPRAANEPLRLRDTAAKMDLAIALDGARSVEGSEAEGLTVYRGAAPGGGDLVHRAVAEGVEDLVLFEQAPAREVLRYQLHLGEGDHAAAGLRLVSGVLEVLDRKGAPIFRARAPYVVDASGRHDAALAVEQCKFDTNPAAPFGRPVIAPGNAWCTVTVDWSSAGVRYPALVDPVWGTTLNTMAVPRARHTLTLLNPTDPKSLALVAGGVSAVGAAPLKSAEIYDPLSRRFSITGAMSVARGGHTATLLTTVDSPGGFSPQEPVLVAGGVDGSGNPIGSLEVYDPASGTFVTDSHTMAAPRFEHAAVLFDDRKVLIAGGTSPPLDQPTNTAYVYTFTAFDAGSPPPSVQSSLDATNVLMTSARTGLAMTRTTTGQVLLSGGFVLAGGALQALQSGEIFDPATGNFGPIATVGVGVTGMTVQRGYHASTALGSSGKILITGGLSKTVNGIYTNTADVYDDGSVSGVKGFIPYPTPITMATARANHSATLLPDGRVLVAGGFGGSPASALNSAEVFSPVTNLFSDLGALVPMQARGDHAALLVNAGDSATAGHTVLVTGGTDAPNSGSTATAGAQILLRLNGDPCTVADECLSGFCVDTVCCDKACDEECYACSAVTKQAGADGVCGFAKQGSDPHVQCINQVETHTQCDGLGSTEQTEETHSCKPAACGANGLCSTGCAQTADCDETGWCDLTQPSSEGDPGTCKPRKSPGAQCYGDDQCDPKHCVDGVCCNTDCVGQCQACNVVGVAGQCSPLGSENDPQDVHANDGPNTGGVKPRTPCNGVVGQIHTACSGACRGIPDKCSYPDATVFLLDDECVDDQAGGPSTLTKFPCDGDGANTEAPSDCAGFKCEDATACKTSCAADTDCITDFVCTDGQCVALTGPLCDGKDTLRQPKAQGGYVVCPDNYACPAGATACLTSCESINDCVTHDANDPIVCTGDKKCVSEPDPLPLPGCSVPLENKGDRSMWWLAAIGAALLVSRRRRG